MEELLDRYLKSLEGTSIDVSKRVREGWAHSLELARAMVSELPPVNDLAAMDHFRARMRLMRMECDPNNLAAFRVDARRAIRRYQELLDIEAEQAAMELREAPGFGIF